MVIRTIWKQLLSTVLLLSSISVYADDKCKLTAPDTGSGVTGFIAWMENVDSQKNCSKDEIKKHIEKYFFQTTVGELNKLYSNNEYATQKIINSHFVWIRGRVNKVRLAALSGSAVVEFNDGGGMLNSNFYIDPFLNGEMEKEQDATLSSLDKGTSVVMQCKEIEFVMSRIVGKQCQIL